MPPTGPHDEALVPAGPVQEASGVVRAQRAYRIAADHERATLRREPPAVPVPEAAPRRPWGPHLLVVGRGLLVAAVVVGLLLWLHVHGSSRVLPDPVNPWATGALSVPVPADAAAAPLGRPAAAPVGEGGYALLFEHGGRPVAFDPCRPVHYVTRLEGAPPQADQLLQSALAQLSAATGLVVVDDGPSDEAPHRDRPPQQTDRYGDRWAPVLIAWSSEAQDPGLAGEVVGYASPVALDPDGRGPRIVTGQVVMDTEMQHPEAVHDVLLHELGHLVGLDHVEDPGDLMHGGSAPAATGLTPGALRGLNVLGQGACFS